MICNTSKWTYTRIQKIVIRFNLQIVHSIAESVNTQVVEVTEKKNEDKPVISPVQPDDIIETITVTVGGEAINLAKDECKNSADLKKKSLLTFRQHIGNLNATMSTWLKKFIICDKTAQNYKICVLICSNGNKCLPMINVSNSVEIRGWYKLFPATIICGRVWDWQQPD